MRSSSFRKAAFFGLVLYGAMTAMVLGAGPVRADDDDRRWRDHQRHEREWREHQRREHWDHAYWDHHDGVAVYAPPAVVYAPPPPPPAVGFVFRLGG